MEESQEILLESLKSLGIQIPQGVSSIKDLTPNTLVSICAQSLLLIDPTMSFPTSLPESMANRFKICTDLASSVSDLGFIGDMSFHKFLYPSEEDLYKLVRFLVKKLSELSELGEAADKRSIITSTITIEHDFKDSTFKEWTEKADNHGVDLIVDGVRTRLKDLRMNSEMPESSNLRSEEVFVTGSRLYQQKFENSKEDMTIVQDDKESMERLVNSRVETFGNEEYTGRMDDKLVLEIEQKLFSQRKQSSELRYKIGKLQSQEKVLMEEASAKVLEAQHLEEEHESLKSAVQIAFDDQNSADFYIAQVNERVDARRRRLMHLEAELDTVIKPLEEKKRSLEKALYATKPEAVEKLKKLNEIELELETVLSEIRNREEEHSKLSADLEIQPKLAPRRSYIQRITEITKNSRKQDADIERILKETRELQLESNSIQERLHRTYAVVDETVFREAKKDPVGRQAYKLLTGIHESFEHISDKILSIDRVRREVGEYEAKLSALASRSFNIDKLQADFDAIRRENEFLEERLRDS
ncbi:Coiled-coil domain-containing protein [Actinidia chinensis var. chinensis]|uniref:Coiled-coil domain-containing protein n=1 Tax=Actinidia chinensis var. chinensis TaxID=1590841 RepID=A0A2R6PQE0_ACTCC|nr:Coiled-coil domain-containing protein [Actinidia chinensis var. chinensis]